jgi:hypothetical protein
MSSLEISKVFTQSLVATQGLISDPATNFYIPPYQRPFAWKDENFERLLTDICAEVERVNDGDDLNAVAYLGSVIVVPDITYEYVQPLHKADMPGGVLHIIDGQQRITTLVVLSGFLATEGERIIQKLRPLQASAVAAGQEEVFQWLLPQLEDLAGELQKMLGSRRSSSDERYRIVPKIIRALHDQWGRTEQVAKYDSAIARFLWEYDSFAATPFSKPYVVTGFASKCPAAALASEYERFEEALDVLQRLLRALLQERRRSTEIGDRAEFEGPEFPSPERIAAGKALGVLCQPPDTCNFTACLSVPKLGSAVGSAIQWLVLGRFLLSRVIVSRISAMRREYAFDLFDSLNTTGAPLTAFETFKAEAMSTIPPAQLAASQSLRSLERVQQVLEGKLGSADRQGRSAELFTAFAASETGFKLGRSPREQRHWLRKRYRAIDGVGREAMLLNMAHSAEWGLFVEHVLPSGANGVHVLPSHARWLAELGPVDRGILRSIQRAKHSIVWPVLQRFAVAALESNSRSDWEDLSSAVKAIAGFSIIWRGAHVGTKSIDSHYRAIMRNIPATVETPEKRGLARLANPPERLLPELKAQLSQILEQAGLGADSMDKWTRVVAACDAYALGEFARLLLIVAHEDAILPEGTTELVVGKVGSCPTLPILDTELGMSWSLEHVAPQNPRLEDDWDAALYGGVPVVHFNRLGNLTLLPPRWNASFGNRSWAVKRELFGALSTRDPLEAQRRIAELASQGISPPPMADRVADTFLPMLEAIGRTSVWSLDAVESRSAVLANLAASRAFRWVFQ